MNNEAVLETKKSKGIRWDESTMVRVHEDFAFVASKCLLWCKCLSCKPQDAENAELMYLDVRRSFYII